MYIIPLPKSWKADYSIWINIVTFVKVLDCYFIFHDSVVIDSILDATSKRHNMELLINHLNTCIYEEEL